MASFISLEGGDGAGKTTQARLLADRLSAAGVDVLQVREPGGAALGENIRKWVKSQSPTPLGELFLFLAARAELVETVIRPALARGAVVVADRFTDSTVAYQGFGRGLDIATVQQLNDIATGGLTPDITFLLDVPPARALARTLGVGGSRPADRTDPPGEKRFEMEGLEFHERVLDGFRTLAEREPSRWFVIDASSPPDIVAARIWSVVNIALGM